jgi:hypothetical protein
LLEELINLFPSAPSASELIEKFWAEVSSPHLILAGSGFGAITEI